MSSRFRSDLALLAITACALLGGGCDREHREYHAAPTEAAPPHPRLSTLQPGDRLANSVDAIGAHYENNAYHINQGSRLYRWFNCNGCHANGGGSIGPALMDAQWRYGGSIEQIHATILEGRPNGMPSYRGKMTDQQAWQLAAYVRALSGNVSKAAAPSRRDAMAATPPLTQIHAQPPRNGDASASTVPSP
jgi:cytochrome c oxidase cbb3-type subunit III